MHMKLLSNSNTAIRQLRITINKIIQWAANQGLSFLTQKTEVILFERRKNKETDSPTSKFGTSLPYGDDVKFLSMTHDKRLNWAEHIKIINNVGPWSPKLKTS